MKIEAITFEYCSFIANSGNEITYTIQYHYQVLFERMHYFFSGPSNTKLLSLIELIECFCKVLLPFNQETCF